MISPAPTSKTPFRRTPPFWSRLLAVLLATTTPAFAAPGPTSSEAELLAVLRDGPEADKAIACKYLAVGGSAAAVDELAGLLSNPRLASWARIALEAMPDAAAAAALREAAAQLDGPLLIGVLSSIGVRGDAAAVPLLTEKLQADTPEVAAAAAWSLSQIASADAAAALVSALSGSSAPDRLDALARAAIPCAARRQAAGDAAGAVTLCETVRAAAVSEQRRAEAIRGIIQATGSGGIPLLIESLRSSPRRVANMAVYTARTLGLGQPPDPSLAAEVDAALIAELKRLHGEGADQPRVLLIRLLGDRNLAGGSPDVLATLVEFLTGQPSGIRLAASEALGKAGDATVVAPLLEALADRDPEIADQACRAIVALDDDAVDQVIERQLAEADAVILPRLIELSGLRRIDVADDLLPLVAHSDSSVRVAALTALGATAGPGALDVLIEAATRPPGIAEAEAARAALREASVRMPDREACAARLAATYDRVGDELRPMLLDILSEVGGTNALAALARAAQSDDDAAADAATRLLGKWMTADAAPVLLDIATAEPGGRFKTRALRGYLRIARQFAVSADERAAMCRAALAAATEEADSRAVLDILVRYPTAESLAVAEEATARPGLEAEAGRAAARIREALRP